MGHRPVLYARTRWPFGPLERFCGRMLIIHDRNAVRPDFGGWETVEVMSEVAALADLCGVSARSVGRWKVTGLSDVRADHVAIRLGVHPAAIWRNWFDAVDLEDAA